MRLRQNQPCDQTTFPRPRPGLEPLSHCSVPSFLGMGCVVLAVLAVLPLASGHCSGEGFPERQCPSRQCRAGWRSPVPRVDTIDAAPGALAMPGAVEVAPDASFFLVSNFRNGAIERFNISSCLSGAVCPSSTLAEGLQAPAGMAITLDGTRAFVAEFSGHRVSAVDIATGNVVTLAGSGEVGVQDGVGTSARMRNPTDVSCNSARKLQCKAAQRL